MRTIKRCGSAKPNYVPYQIEHRHGANFGARSNISAEEFKQHLASGMLELVAPKLAIVRQGFLAVLDSESKEWTFLKASGRLLLNWDLIKKQAKYYKPLVGRTAAARLADGQDLVEQEPEYERAERRIDGQVIIRKQLLYNVTPLC